MTTAPVTPAHQQILDGLREAAVLRDRARSEERQAIAQVRELIRQGGQTGVPMTHMAEAAGCSRQALLDDQPLSWTIRANGPDGIVDHFYADTDLMSAEVVDARWAEVAHGLAEALQDQASHARIAGSVSKQAAAALAAYRALAGEEKA